METDRGQTHGLGGENRDILWETRQAVEDLEPKETLFHKFVSKKGKEKEVGKRVVEEFTENPPSLGPDYCLTETRPIFQGIDGLQASKGR